MSREIKFRAKCARTGEWKYGFLSNHSTLTINSVRLKIDQETIGQYTGLKDKNGKEIYEGYIVKIIDLNQNVIVKSIGINVLRNADDEYFYEPSFHSIFVKAKQNAITITDGSKCEVVGNIYQNQDLLK